MFLPVAMHVAGAVGVAEVDEGGVDEDVLLALLQQILQVAQVTEAAPHPIPRQVCPNHTKPFC